MSLAAYIAEDGLVSHHWEEGSLGLANCISSCTGEFQGQEVGDTSSGGGVGGGVLVSSYCCSSYMVADPFSSLGTFPGSFTGDPVFHPSIKEKHGGTHGSSCIYSRGWPSQPSMGGEALGLVKILGPSIGECQGQEVGVGGLGSRGRGN